MVEVACCAGVSVETLRKIETGRSPSPEFFTILRICSEIGLSMDGFMVADVVEDGTTAVAS
jgi:transcriptional regulator with XRE-family HTH domain